jgi:hypothetical protein
MEWLLYQAYEMLWDTFEVVNMQDTRIWFRLKPACFRFFINVQTVAWLLSGNNSNFPGINYL